MSSNVVKSDLCRNNSHAKIIFKSKQKKMGTKVKDVKVRQKLKWDRYKNLTKLGLDPQSFFNVTIQQPKIVGLTHFHTYPLS